MNIFQGIKNRQIIPRWNTLKETCHLIPEGVQKRLWIPKLISRDELEIKQARWRETRNIWFAIDLVCSSSLLGDEYTIDVINASEYIVSNSDNLICTVTNAAKEVLAIKEEYYDSKELTIYNIREQIKKLKIVANAGLYDPFLFLDMAYYYSLLAQNWKAEEYIRLALAIGEDNPLILRAAARFYLHKEQSPEMSLRILRKSRATPHIPALMSAEIAISEAFELKSPFRTRGRRKIDDMNFHPWQLAELAGTIGTMELKAHSMKKAKHALERAMICPNENTIAQIRWLDPERRIIKEESNCKPMATFEADTFTSFREGNYQEAFNSSVDWMNFQPISARPAVMASFISSVSLNDYRTSIRVSKQGLIASPESFSLRNNLVFALASIDKMQDAQSEIQKISQVNLNPIERNVLKATQGLVAFRNGDIDSGRILYNEVIRRFEDLDDKKKACAAKLFWAREEYYAKTDMFKSLAREVLDEADNLEGYCILEKFKKYLS